MYVVIYTAAILVFFLGFHFEYFCRGYMRDIYNCTCREAGGMHIDNWNIKGRHDRFFFQENILEVRYPKRDAQKFYSALPVIYKSTKKKSDVSRNVRRMRSERVNLFFVSLSLCLTKDFLKSPSEKILTI